MLNGVGSLSFKMYSLTNLLSTLLCYCTFLNSSIQQTVNFFCKTYRNETNNLYRTYFSRRTEQKLCPEQCSFQCCRILGLGKMFRILNNAKTLCSFWHEIDLKGNISRNWNLLEIAQEKIVGGAHEIEYYLLTMFLCEVATHLQYDINISR